MCRIISFVSAKGGSGQTSVVSMLASGLAEKGRFVCVIDGVFAFNEFALSMERSRAFDLAEYLAGNIGLLDALNKAQENLYFIKTNEAGFVYLKFGELIDKMIFALSERFDYILIDVNTHDKNNLNLFLSVSTEVFIIVSQDKNTLLGSRKILKRIDFYKNITNVKIIVNKFKTISSLKNKSLNEGDIEAIVGRKIIFCFPKFLKHNIFNKKCGVKFLYYQKLFEESVEKNDWIKADYKREYFGLIGRVKRLVYYKFE